VDVEAGQGLYLLGSFPVLPSSMSIVPGSIKYAERQCARRSISTKKSTARDVIGRCLCGAITYSISGEPLGMGQCHCKDCQRASGTGHMSLARFKKG
jgi:hypothetical protein